MAYLAVRFELESAFAESFCDALLARGALSVDLSDKNAETPDETPIYNEPKSAFSNENAPTRYWAVALITALFASNITQGDITELLGEIAAEEGIALPLFETYPVAERDWVRETQSQFSAIPISDDFFIVPTWQEVPKAARYALRLDPGLAFGTGSHPTTRLCLRWLTQNPPQNLATLDYGCGSGILLLAARLLGAASQTSFGVDIDPQAVAASIENARANELAVSFGLPDQLPEAWRFDVTLANILANPLRLLAPLLAQKTRCGGTIILSGILASQRHEVMASYQEWFNISCWQEEEGWALLTGVRRSSP